MLNQKRIEAEREIVRQTYRDDWPRLVESVGQRYENVRGFLETESSGSLQASGIFGMNGGSTRQAIIAITKSQAQRRLAQSWGLSAAWMIQHLNMERRAGATGAKAAAHLLLPYTVAVRCVEYHSIGWHSIGDIAVKEAWTTWRMQKPDLEHVLIGDPDAPATFPGGPTIYERDRDFWMATMMLVDPEIWRPLGYAPNPDDMGPHFLLAQRWDDPDPARVRNVLQAVREANLGMLLVKDVPEGTRRSGVDSHLLFDDYEVRAVQMMRRARGLAPADGVESYLGHPPDPLEPLPFVRDPVMWPLYEKLCGMMGAEPVTPEGVPVIEAELDVERMEIVQL